MCAKKTTSVESYKLENQFKLQRSRLADPMYATSLEKPLAFWTIPSDRGLPLVFMGRSVQELLETPFSDLLGTAGVGFRKMANLITLLQRITPEGSDGPSPGPAAVQNAGAAVHEGAGVAENFNADTVSEALWTQWRETVRRHDLGDMLLGRIAPSLQSMPTVIWNTPLGFYLDHTLAEIRELKTHGEKRVRAVLEVFSMIHGALAQATVHPNLTINLMPSLIQHLERVTSAALSRLQPVTADEIRHVLGGPMVEQIRIDIGPTVAQLAADRLGLNGPPKSVRDQAQKLDITRARVYQLLEDCSQVMRVRWREGEWLLLALEHKLRTMHASVESCQAIALVIDIFYHRLEEPSMISSPPTDFQPDLSSETIVSS